MLPIRDYEARFQEILEAMDAACEQMEDQDAETLEELNAEFEDALFMLGEIDPKDEGANEELRDALEELDALRADYQKLSMRFVGADASHGKSGGLRFPGESAVTRRARERTAAASSPQ